jgi:hypothetical protein
MIKFVDDFSKTKPAERDHKWSEDALDHGHIASAFLNLPHEPAEEEPGPGIPPGFGMAEIGGVLHMFDVPHF